MSPAAVATPRPAMASSGRMLLLQTYTGVLSLLRIPAFSVTGVALPVMFFAFFGLPNVGKALGGIDAGEYMLATYGAYALSSMMLFNFGIGVAQERGMKTDLLTRATPLPVSVYLVAKLLVAMIFGLVAVGVLFAFGAVAGHIFIPLDRLLVIVARLLLGSLPFVALGFAIGYSFGPNAAPGVTNLLYLPMAFASGLLAPLEFLPDFVKQVAPYLPTYHYGQLALSSVGAKAEDWMTSAVWLAGYTVLFFAIAFRQYRREENRKYG